MQYLVTANRPFEEIEAQTILALEQQGFQVQRTFSLQSAVGTRSEEGTCPGYTVLLVKSPKAPQEAPALVTLHAQAGWTVIRSQLPKPAPLVRQPGEVCTNQDVDAVLAAALGTDAGDPVPGQVIEAGIREWDAARRARTGGRL